MGGPEILGSASSKETKYRTDRLRPTPACARGEVHKTSALRREGAKIGIFAYEAVPNRPDRSTKR